MEITKTNINSQKVDKVKEKIDICILFCRLFLIYSLKPSKIAANPDPSKEQEEELQSGL